MASRKQSLNPLKFQLNSRKIRESSLKRNHRHEFSTHINQNQNKKRNSSNFNIFEKSKNVKFSVPAKFRTRTSISSNKNPLFSIIGSKREIPKKFDNPKNMF